MIMRVALLISFKNFKDEEYFETRRVLEEGGCRVVTVSSRPGLARGSDGGQIKVDKTFEELSLSDYQGLVLIGGSGALDDMDNDQVCRLVQQAYQSPGFLLAAICISPLILARSGKVAGRQMTVWSNSLQRWAIKELEDRGVVYVDQPVVVDGHLVTANGPAAAAEFGQKIVEVLDKLAD